MNEFLDRILNLPKQQKLGLLAGLIIFLLGLDYYFLYSPRSDQIIKLSEDIESSQFKRNKLKKDVVNLPKLKQERQKLEGVLKETVAQLPDKKEIPDLLSTISTKASEAGLQILVFRPAGENAKDFYAEIPVNLVVRGGFHEVVTFFDEVGRLNRVVNIQNIDIKKPQTRGDSSIVETSALATTFRFLDEAERKRIAKAKAAKKKR